MHSFNPFEASNIVRQRFNVQTFSQSPDVISNQQLNYFYDMIDHAILQFFPILSPNLEGDRDLTDWRTGLQIPNPSISTLLQGPPVRLLNPPVRRPFSAPASINVPITRAPQGRPPEESRGAPRSELKPKDSGEVTCDLGKSPSSIYQTSPNLRRSNSLPNLQSSKIEVFAPWRSYLNNNITGMLNSVVTKVCKFFVDLIL